MPETSDVSNIVKRILGLVGAEGGLPINFGQKFMRDLSLNQVGVLEDHLKKLPLSPGVSGTLEGIQHARLAGIGPFEGTLPALVIPDKLKPLIEFAKRNPFEIKKAPFISAYTEAITTLEPKEALAVHEELKRVKHLHMSFGPSSVIRGDIENGFGSIIGAAGERAGVKATVVETIKPSVSSGHYSSSSLATETAKAEESWVARLSKESWVGKKGLVVAGATVGVGAVIYGAKKLLGRDRASENQQER